MTPRQKMLEKVRAIMAKTMDNGCTEEEAMTALEKARELMAAYDISESDLGVTQHQEGANIHTTTEEDPYNARRYVAVGVAKFTRTRVWRNQFDAVVFCGLESETAFASWLVDTLQAFILRELKKYQADRRRQGLKCPRIIGASFVRGCAERIRQRLDELSPKDAPTGNALVVLRQALILQAMKEAGIMVGKARSRRSSADAAAWNAGQAAGNNARFDRPVHSGGTLRLS